MSKRNRAIWFICGLVGAVGWVECVRAEQILRTGGLGALERRAIMAQALVQQVETLEQEIDHLREEIKSLGEHLDALRDDVARGQEELAKLKELLESRDREIERQKEMLAVFRNGSFEYYEVREGDTLEQIAANPMVYGDPSRWALIGQANDLSNTNELHTGTILIIPRYPEGVLHAL